MKRKLTPLISCAFICLAANTAFAELTAGQARDVWLKVAEPIALTELPFYVKESITPNAWVRRGKSVTVTTALLKLLDTEDELYGVLAHEAGHVKLDHHSARKGRNVTRGIASTVLGSLLGRGARVAVNVGVGLADAGYSRGQEIEADDYAVRLAHENEWETTGLYSALQKLSRANRTEPSGFNSHPPDERRLLHIKNTILSLEPEAEIPEPLPEKDPLQEKIDNAFRGNEKQETEESGSGGS